jgi:uncharacterized protein YcfJ
MKRSLLAAGATAVLLALGQTAAAQMVPSVEFTPPPGKPYSAFQEDDAVCQQWANNQVAAAENQAQGQAVGSAVIGGLLGAGIGAAIGGGRGAAIGAGTGAIAGGAEGEARAQNTQYYAQQRFDALYQQCMVGRGDPAPGYPPAYRRAEPTGAPPPPPPAGSAPMGPDDN